MGKYFLSLLFPSQPGLRTSISHKKNSAGEQRHHRSQSLPVFQHPLWFWSQTLLLCSKVSKTSTWCYLWHFHFVIKMNISASPAGSSNAIFSSWGEILLKENKDKGFFFFLQAFKSIFPCGNSSSRINSMQHRKLIRWAPEISLSSSPHVF